MVELEVLGGLVLDLAVMGRFVRGVCHRERGDVRGRIDGSFDGNGGRVLERLDRWSRIHRYFLEGGGEECAHLLGWLAPDYCLLCCLGTLQLSL